jgi:hypothetical protein
MLGAGTSLGGCQAAIAAANECAPIEECCGVYHSQVQECLGVPNATDGNFDQNLKDQTEAAGCPRTCCFPCGFRCRGNFRIRFVCIP